MNFTTADIKKNIDSSSYKRGLEYYEQNKVIGYSVKVENDNFVKLISTVKGSNGELYMQETIISNANGEVSIAGECECPVGVNCKHIAAVCFLYISQLVVKEIEPELAPKVIEEDNTELNIWLENLKKTIDTKAKEKNIADDGAYFLTYRFMRTDKSNKHELLFYKSKFLKSGAISQGTHLDSYKFLDDTDTYTFTKTSDDEDIIKMSKSVYNYNRRYGEETKFRGTLGYLLIKEILRTNRCYFEENKEIIHFDNEIFKPEFDFELQDGEYTLKSNVDEKYFKIFETKPMLIIDIKKNIIQEVDIDVDAYKELKVAPKIPKKDIGRVFTNIGNTVSNIQIIAPTEIYSKTIDTKPTPRLHLKYTKVENEKNFTSFKIDFLYDKYVVKYDPQEKKHFIYEDDEKIDIIRDLAFENEIKDKIVNFGFDIQILDDDLFVILQKKNRQEQLQVWKQFLNINLLELEEEGWIIETDEEFNMKFESNSSVVVDSDDKNNWFSLSFNLEFNGASYPIAPLVSSIIDEFDDLDNMPEIVNIEIDENHFVEVETKLILPIIKTIVELYDKKDKDGSIKVSAYDAHLVEFMDDGIIWRGSRDVLALSQKLKNFKEITQVETPKCLNATLREYQQEGLNWLNFLYEFNFCGILADDMGLGKTIQTLTHLSKLKEDGKLTNPSIIVMPTSLIANWKNEAKKFTPNLSVLSLHGMDRAKKFGEIEEFDILLTTYPLIVRDKDEFDKHEFLYIILDEAQKIKNPKTKMAIAIKTFKSEHRLALSGTPIENHLGELWSIFSFLMPGFLDTLSFFRKYYQVPIEKEHDFERQNLLNKRVKPFMIRRTKEKVVDELPEKTEIVKYTQFDDAQSKLYESIRVTMEAKVREAVSQKGLGSSHITILDALLKLRQVCCDPNLLKMQEAEKVKESAKLELLFELLDELLQEGRKILIFSQFTSMLSIIEKRVVEKNIRYVKLTGSTTKREEVVDKFTRGEADLFLISLKAGGVGLNLVEADTVIHYDPWWNPAVENQATDRAYRIGQTKAVFVYKLIVENTIEQKILELQQKKQDIQDGIYDNDKQQEDIKFSGNELLELLK